MNKLFDQALPVLNEIEAHGFQAYFVGGCVRDYFLKREINDIDIAVSATPEEIKKIFNKTIDIGIEHGTVMVLHEKGHFEVTTFRTESTYSDSRRPDEVTFVRSLEEDLKRRDFTMNAMALSSTYQLTDLFGGRIDLRNREIRTVGIPVERFSEDALRMMRAIRFVSQLDFSIEHHTFEAIKKNAHTLTKVAQERITAEFEKLLAGPAMQKALQYAVTADILSYIPDLITKNIVMLLKELKWHSLQPEERLALIICIGEYQDIFVLLKKWRMSNKVIQKQKLLADLLQLRKNRMFNRVDLYHYGIEAVKSAERITAVWNREYFNSEHLDDLYQSMVIKTRSDLAFIGSDLIKWTGKGGGPWVKECTEIIEQLILSGQLQNNMSDIKKWVETTWLQR